MVLRYTLTARWALTPDLAIWLIPDHVLTPAQDLTCSAAGHRSSKTALIGSALKFLGNSASASRAGGASD
jgi:hypothetical protein